MQGAELEIFARGLNFNIKGVGEKYHALREMSKLTPLHVAQKNLFWEEGAQRSEK